MFETLAFHFIGLALVALCVAVAVVPNARAPKRLPQRLS